MLKKCGLLVPRMALLKVTSLKEWCETTGDNFRRMQFWVCGPNDTGWFLTQDYIPQVLLVVREGRQLSPDVVLRLWLMGGFLTQNHIPQVLSPTNVSNPVHFVRVLQRPSHHSTYY